MAKSKQLKNIPEKKRLLISFSGGRTSAYMTWWLLNEWKDRREYEIIVVFANTGKEREETLDFVWNCDRYFKFNTVWIECVVNMEFGKGVKAKQITYDTANRDGQVFEDVIKKYGIPNSNSPHCTTQMKRETVYAYARSIGWEKNEYDTAIGIRYDEPQRLKWEWAKKNRLIYPLVTIKKTIKNDINVFWDGQPFKLELKSYEGNCTFCWKKPFRTLMTIAKNTPQVTAWWIEMQEKYGNYIPEHRKENKKLKLPITFFRGKSTVEDIIEDAKFEFIEEVDISGDIAQFVQTTWDDFFDHSDGCTSSCEPF